VAWPIIPDDDLERTIAFFSPDPDEDEDAPLDGQEVADAVLDSLVLPEPVE
jgi:hypothetical protein